MMTPNWPKEQKILRLRYVLALTLVSFQLTGIYRFPWRVFGLLMGLGVLLTLVNLYMTERRWRALPAFNLVADQLVTLLVLVLTGGAASPFVFLCYMHIMSAIVFTSGSRFVLFIGALQVASVLTSTLGAGLLERGIAWQAAGVHAVALLIIAALLTEPVVSLRQEAETDPLTGALNRRSGLDQLSSWTELGEPFNLLFADLKHFKQINDTHGHAVGDEVLSLVAQRLGEGLRADDLIIRYGGDEFLVATRGESEAIRARLQKRLSEPLLTSSGQLNLRVDLGGAHFPDEGRDMSELIMRADEAMFAHKRA